MKEGNYRKQDVLHLLDVGCFNALVGCSIVLVSYLYCHIYLSAFGVTVHFTGKFLKPIETLQVCFHVQASTSLKCPHNAQILSTEGLLLPSKLDPAGCCL